MQHRLQIDDAFENLVGGKWRTMGHCLQLTNLVEKQTEDHL